MFYLEKFHNEFSRQKKWSFTRVKYLSVLVLRNGVERLIEAENLVKGILFILEKFCYWC